MPHATTVALVPPAAVRGAGTVRPEVFGGQPIIRNMRLSVELVLSLLAQGVTPEAILEDDPDLEAGRHPRVYRLRARGVSGSVVRFLVDRCAGHRLAAWLRSQGHDVLGRVAHAVCLLKQKRAFTIPIHPGEAQRLALPAPARALTALDVKFSSRGVTDWSNDVTTMAPGF